MCHAYRLTKPRQHLPHGKLQLLPIPIGPRKDWKATDLANVLVENVFSTFGKPVLLMNNQGFLFTSNYWSHFCYYLSVQLKLAEFAYNNLVYSSIRIAPFIAIYDKESTWTNEIRDERLKDVLFAKTKALNIARVKEKLKARLKKA